VDRIIPICKLAIAGALITAPSLAAAKQDDPVNRYAAARLAEMSDRADVALKDYIELYREAPGSAVLADRIFDSAIRVGDMAAALRAVRAQELSGEISAEAPLLLFADAYGKRNWSMALLAADELAASSNFGFIAPILRSWVNVGQRKAPDLPAADPQADPLFAFYANDQRIYLDLASGNYSSAKLGLRSIAAMNGAYVRDLMLRAAPVIAAQGDEAFADALIGTAMGADRLAPGGGKGSVKLSAAEGLSALHVRLAAALLEQNVTNQALVLARLGVIYAPDREPAKLVLGNALDANGLGRQAAAVRATIADTSSYWPQAIQDRAAKLSPDEGVVLTAAAARRWPQSMALALLSAQSQEAAKDLDGAVNSFRKIVETAEKAGVAPRRRAYYHLMLASALDNAGNWVAAREALDKALVLDPNNAQILNYLGYSLLERNELARALPMIRKAYQFAPDSPAITDSMGWAYFQSGEFGEAVILLEKAAKAAGNDLAINEHLGDAYWRSGRLRDARYSWGVASQTAEGDAVQRLAGKIDIGLPSR
jgi:tetratricopeptide (TPR) repeat protein